MRRNLKKDGPMAFSRSVTVLADRVLLLEYMDEELHLTCVLSCACVVGAYIFDERCSCRQLGESSQGYDVVYHPERLFFADTSGLLLSDFLFLLGGIASTRWPCMMIRLWSTLWFLSPKIMKITNWSIQMMPRHHTLPKVGKFKNLCFLSTKYFLQIAYKRCQKVKDRV